MNFGILQNSFFSANDGAYSIITPTERGDGQITITEAEGEAALVIDHFGAENIPRMRAEGVKQSLTVRHRDGTESKEQITINFPKAEGNELRIYRQQVAGFDFEAGDVWFVFKRGPKLIVGCMKETEWRGIGTTDSSDDAFQTEIESTKEDFEPNYLEFAGRKIARDPKISREAMLRSGYICEYSGQLTPFISRCTGHPYVEAHHLIPLFLQPRFDFPLDRIENVVALNPLWHRAIHHAEHTRVEGILTHLAAKRQPFLESHNISSEDLIRFYGAEKIV